MYTNKLLYKLSSGTHSFSAASGALQPHTWEQRALDSGMLLLPEHMCVMGIKVLGMPHVKESLGCAPAHSNTAVVSGPNSFHTAALSCERSLFPSPTAAWSTKGG